MVGQMIVFFCVAVFLRTLNGVLYIHRSKQQVLMGGKEFSNQVPLNKRIKLKENNLFATTQYTGATTSQAVVFSLRQTKLNKNYKLSSEGKSLLLQDLVIFKTINESFQ